MESHGSMYWETDAPDYPVTLVETEHFDARGMKRVYGRGDYFQRYRTFNMDIWKDRSGRLFMRFWSRSGDVDWRSYELKGMDGSTIPVDIHHSDCIDYWVPIRVRDAYEQWIREEW